MAQRPGQRPAPPAWKIPLVGSVLGVLASLVGLAINNDKLFTFGLVWTVVHLLSSAVFFFVYRRR